jgi:antitoxin component of MazEF toxin-antitoxin module
MVNSTEYRKVQGLIGETSFSLILPKMYAKNIGLEKGDFVKVQQEGSRIIIEKADS